MKSLAIAGGCLVACSSSPSPSPVEPALPPGVVADAAPAPVVEAGPDAAPATYKGLGATSLPADVVARYAPPTLPPAVTRRIQAMLDVRGAQAGVFTRRGDRMLFSWKVTGQVQVWRQDGPMKFPVQLTGGEDATTVEDIAPDDKFAVVSRDVSGSENPGLYALSLAGGSLVAIQHVPNIQTLFGFVSRDSRYVYYRSNDVAADSYALYRWDTQDRRREAVLTEPGLWGFADHDGERLLLTKRRSADVYEVYRYHVREKKLEPVVGQGEQEDYAAAFGARPGTIILRTNKYGEFFRLYEWKAGEVKPITPDEKHEVASFAIDRAKKRLYYVVNVDGYMRTVVLDARTYKPLALPRLPAADNVLFGGASRDGRQAQLVIDGAQRAPETVVYDWKSRKVTTWRVPSTPEVDVARFAAQTLETYPARDGTKIPMFVRRPAGCPLPGKVAGTPCPVVVSFHGGPEQQAKPGFNATAQLYVDAGFVYVQPNVRGSSGYGKTWMHVDDGPRRLGVITDIEDCARHIRSAWAIGGVAPKLGVTGGSYGGYATLMAMTYFAGAYDAGVEVVGISNLVTFLENTAPYRRSLRTGEYGDPTTDRAAMIELSPITHIAKLKAPLLAIQGLNDPRVPVGEAVQIHRAAQARGVDGDLIVFPDEGHGVVKRPNQVLALGHALAFFEKHLK